MKFSIQEATHSLITMHLIHYLPNMTQSAVIFCNPWPLPKPLSPSPQFLETQMLSQSPSGIGALKPLPTSTTQVCHHLPWLMTQCLPGLTTLIFRPHSLQLALAQLHPWLHHYPGLPHWYTINWIQELKKYIKPIDVLIPFALLFVTVPSNASLLPRPHPSDAGFTCFLIQAGLHEMNNPVNKIWEAILQSCASFTYCLLSWFCILGSYQSLLEEMLRAMIPNSVTNSYNFISA